MKQLLIQRGEVIIEEVPAPKVEPGCILVEVHYSLISSGTEISSVESSGKSLISRAIEAPEKTAKLLKSIPQKGIHYAIGKVQNQIAASRQTGYSCSGIVIEVGSGVTNIQKGERVACAGAGVANHAEYVLVPENLWVKVPPGCDLKSAASVALGAIGMQGVRRADPRLGENVAVIGLGLLGQIMVQMLKAAGCRVIGVDIDPNRVQLAKQLGADAVLNSMEVDVKNEIRHLTGGHGVDTAIIAASSKSNQIIQQAMEITRKKGRIVLVGAVGMQLQRSPFYEKEIDFLISSSYGPGRYDDRYEHNGLDYPYAYVRWTENRNMHEYLRLVSEGKIKLGQIFEKEHPLSEASAAYGQLRTAMDKPLGILLRYPATDDLPKSPTPSTRVLLRQTTNTGKIRIAVVGAGNFAKAMHLPNLKKLSNSYHIRTIVSKTGSNAKTTAQRFGADFASTDYQDVLTDPEVDAVLICTRHDLHAQQAIQAARAGKAIFLEKPMAMNRQELDQLALVLWETGVPFMVGFNRRFSPAAQRAKEVLTGRQNPLIMIYRMNAGYLPPDHWTQGEEGGGRIIGEACHIIDLFRYFVDSPVVNVSATAISPLTDHVLSGDNTSVTIKYADGSVATFLYTALGSPDLEKEYMEIYSDGKVIVLNDYISLKVHGCNWKEWKAKSPQKGHFEELNVFADYIRKSGVFPITLDDMLETTNVSIMVNDISSKKLSTNLKPSQYNNK
jgi:predicted dehydrogenase/threonine dehydrogenase-like Zn-dependent dehydrogenase